MNKHCVTNWMPARRLWPLLLCAANWSGYAWKACSKDASQGTAREHRRTQPLEQTHLSHEILAVRRVGVGTDVRLGVPAASGAVAVLEAKQDALARRLDGLLRCKDEFAELARCL